jgi:ribonuclease P protein component
MRPGNANRPRLTFHKRERLCSETAIADLFRLRQQFFCFPFRCFYQFRPANGEDDVNQLVISVSKRNFKHAVDRNRVKRLIREAYRLHHREHLDPVLKAHGQRVRFCLSYATSEILPYKFIQDKIIEVLKRLTNVEQSKDS